MTSAFVFQVDRGGRKFICISGGGIVPAFSCLSMRIPAKKSRCCAATLMKRNERMVSGILRF